MINFREDRAEECEETTPLGPDAAREVGQDRLRTCEAPEPRDTLGPVRSSEGVLGPDRWDLLPVGEVCDPAFKRGGRADAG